MRLPVAGLFCGGKNRKVSFGSVAVLDFFHSEQNSAYNNSAENQVHHGRDSPFCISGENPAEAANNFDVGYVRQEGEMSNHWMFLHRKEVYCCPA